MTPEQIRAVMPYTAGAADTFAQPLTAAMQEFAITTAKRQAAFLAQVAEESGELRYLRELADGSAYEGRADLGNVDPGDGQRYRGRGLLMITGRTNYEACGRALGLTLVLNPSLLETPLAACRSAAWFWQMRGLNELADSEAFGSICHRINGGYLGLDARIRYYIVARRTLGI